MSNAHVHPTINAALAAFSPPQPCRCDAYVFPHRRGSGACETGTNIHGFDDIAQHERLESLAINGGNARAINREYQR